jgi:hypothetical protein
MSLIKRLKNALQNFNESEISENLALEFDDTDLNHPLGYITGGNSEENQFYFCLYNNRFWHATAIMSESNFAPDKVNDFIKMLYSATEIIKYCPYCPEISYRKNKDGDIIIDIKDEKGLIYFLGHLGDYNESDFEIIKVYLSQF